VVVVDDTVRTYMRRALEEHGFSVSAVGTPDDALRASGPVDLVVADLTMQGSHGPELVARLAARLGSVPALYLAADAVDALVDRTAAPGHVLAAPYSIDRLLEAARVALSPVPAAGPLDGHAAHDSGPVTPSAGGEGG
jgi:CheY-like chemotaxis protein